MSSRLNGTGASSTLPVAFTDLLAGDEDNAFFHEPRPDESLESLHCIKNVRALVAELFIEQSSAGEAHLSIMCSYAEKQDKAPGSERESRVGSIYLG